MNKIEEVIRKNSTYPNSDLIPSLSYRQQVMAMKEYAEFYAKKCLEIAAQSASANFECIGAVLGAENVNPYVEVESILNIKLPTHD